MEQKPLKIGVDFIASNTAKNQLPLITIISGKYKGLQYELLSSGLSKQPGEEDSRFNAEFKLRQYWESVRGQEKFEATEEDKYFVIWSAFCYVTQKQQELAKD